MLRFLKTANGIFKQAFADYDKPTSLSFGVTIHYEKFPLYEALRLSQDMLFGVAKAEKNGAAIQLQKHAGQSAAVFIYNDALEEVLSLQADIFTNADNEVLLSAMHKLALFESAFLCADSTAAVQNLFENTFDAAAHENNDFVHKRLPLFYDTLRTAQHIRAVDAPCNPVRAMGYLLRILKFFVEKEGDRT